MTNSKSIVDYDRTPCAFVAPSASNRLRHAPSPWAPDSEREALLVVQNEDYEDKHCQRCGKVADLVRAVLGTNQCNEHRPRHGGGEVEEQRGTYSHEGMMIEAGRFREDPHPEATS